MAPKASELVALSPTPWFLEGRQQASQEMKPKWLPDRITDGQCLKLFVTIYFYLPLSMRDFVFTPDVVLPAGHHACGRNSPRHSSSSLRRFSSGSHPRSRGELVSTSPAPVRRAPSHDALRPASEVPSTQEGLYQELSQQGMRGEEEEEIVDREEVCILLPLHSAFSCFTSLCCVRLDFW